MNITREQMIARLDQFSDEVLLDKWTAGGLTDLGKDALASILYSRGIMPSKSGTPAPTVPAKVPRPSSGPYETLAHFKNPLKAEILCARLNTEDIAAIAVDRNMVSASMVRTGAVGGIRVQVPRDHLDAARDIMDRLERGEFAIDDSYEDES